MPRSIVVPADLYNYGIGCLKMDLKILLVIGQTHALHNPYTPLRYPSVKFSFSFSHLVFHYLGFYRICPVKGEILISGLQRQATSIPKTAT